MRGHDRPLHLGGYGRSPHCSISKSPNPAYLFVREGEYWTIAFYGTVSRFRHSGPRRTVVSATIYAVAFGG